jgi:hypothetical protein
VVRSFSQAEDSVVSTARLSGEERNYKRMHISRLFAILFLVAAGSLTGCFTTPDSAQATIVNPCHQEPIGTTGIASPVLCAVAVFNLPTSHDPFKWSASSSASGTIFVPASNLSPGISPNATQSVAVTIPAGACPVTLTFTDGSTNITATATFGNPCVTPPPLPTP